MEPYPQVAEVSNVFRGAVVVGASHLGLRPLPAGGHHPPPGEQVEVCNGCVLAPPQQL